MHLKRLLVTMLAVSICLQTNIAVCAAENTDITVEDVGTEGQDDAEQEEYEEKNEVTMETASAEDEEPETAEARPEKEESAEEAVRTEVSEEPSTETAGQQEQTPAAGDEQEMDGMVDVSAEDTRLETSLPEEPAPFDDNGLTESTEIDAGTKEDAPETENPDVVTDEVADTANEECDDEEMITAPAEIFSGNEEKNVVKKASRAQVIKIAYGWVTEKGKQYYYGKNGNLCKGITNIDGKDYVLDPVTGELRRGLVVIDGKTYHGSASGRLSKGWVVTGGNKYYMNPDTGAAVTGFKDIGGRSYFFNGDGTAKQGVVRIGKSVYYFHPTVGYMLTGWRDVNNRRYYFADNNMDNYRESLEGRRLMGFTSIGGNTYYFTTSSMSGYRTYYYSTLATGLKEIAGEKYYFTYKGVMERSGWKTVDGERYHFDENGVMDTGWKTENGKTYHYTSGKKDTGWRKIGENLYYFYHDGHRQDNGIAVIGGKRCAFDANGVCTSTNVTVSDVVEYAKYWVNKIPYKSSVTKDDPNNERYLELKEGRGSDCSWFVFHCLEKYGYLTEFVHSYEWGSSPSLYKKGKEIGKDISKAKPGDIICYAYGSGMNGNRKSSNSHVAIYIGGGKQVDCGAGKGVRISSVQYGSIYNIVRFSD